MKTFYVIFYENKKSKKNRVTETKSVFLDCHQFVSIISRNFGKFHFRPIKIALDINNSFILPISVLCWCVIKGVVSDNNLYLIS